MSEPGPTTRPAVVILAALFLTLLPVETVTRGGGPFLLLVIGTWPPIWSAVGLGLGLTVVVGGLYAAVGLLQGRRWGWYASLGIAAVVTVTALGSTLYIRGLEDPALLRFYANAVFGRQHDAALAGIALILLALPDSRRFCGIDLTSS